MNIAANRAFFLKVYLFVTLIEGLVVLTSLMLIPSDAKNALLLGFSSSRLALMGIVLLASLSFGGLGVWLSVSASAFQKASPSIDCLLATPLSRVGLLLLSLSGMILLLIPPQRWGDAVDQFQRLAPLVAWLAVVAVQTLILQFRWLDQKVYWQNLLDWKSTLRLALIAASLLTVISIVIIWSRIGIEPDRSGWYKPGTPLLITQLFIAWVFGTAMIFRGAHFEKWLASLSPKLKLDLLIGVALWLTAVLIWGMEPLRSNSYFVQRPTPPNFAYYPYSDARLYDESAQSILVGAAHNTGLLVRPLYAFLLALLHILDGQRYEQTILLQVAVLAAIPALLFGLGLYLGGRPAGVIAALLAIFRERNSIALTNVIEVSHSKLILADVPAMLFVLLFLLVLVKWLSQSPQKYRWGIAAGASLGLLILIRSQAQLLIPVVLVGIFFVLRFQWRRLLQYSAVFVLGLLAVLAPWVWRNYAVSGHAVVESTEFYIGFFASSYREEGQTIRPLPGESSDDFYERMQGQIRDYLVNHPDEVTHFYASHFIHNEIESIVYLPMSLRLYDLRTYVKEMTFWDALQIDLRPGSVILFFLSLGLMALGMGVAVNRLGILGLAPLLIHLGYSLTVVPVRLSGWRFILPVDWVPMLYYAVGLAALTAMALAILSKRYAGMGSEQRSVDRAEKNDRAKFLPVLAAFLMLGLSFPLVAHYAPTRYPQTEPDELIQRYAPVLLGDGTTLTGPDLLAFVEHEPRAIVAEGRALYPSYFKRGAYWGDDNSYNLDIRDYRRVQFNLVGPYRKGIFLPVAAAPEIFPHASDVLVIGCLTETGNSLRALLVIVNAERVLSTSPWNGLTCTETK